MAGGKEKIDLRRPRTDAMDCRHAFQRGVRRQAAQSVKVEILADDSLGDGRQRALLGPRKACRPPDLFAGSQESGFLEWPDQCLETFADGIRAGLRDLLGNHDFSQARETGPAAAQGHFARDHDRSRKMRIGPRQMVEAFGNVGQAVDCPHRLATLMWSGAPGLPVSQGPMTLTAVFRFAPSPNGALHLGHAYSAALNAHMAREAGGRFLLRIEDIDLVRCRPEHEVQLIDDLAWLGLAWEQPVRRQSDQVADYAAALDVLRDSGLAYASGLSRADVRRIVEAEESAGRPWPRDPDGAPHFPGREAAETADGDEDVVWRLDVKAAMAHAWREPSGWLETGAGPDGETGWQLARPELWGDFVLARRDAPASYHLAVVVDDALQGVTHVVRGRDLFHATAAHVLLQDLLGFARPVYHHHDLVVDRLSGAKLSKSRGDTAIRQLRDAGMTPGDVLRLAGADRFAVQ